jgi:hypothetical protein
MRVTSSMTRFMTALTVRGSRVASQSRASTDLRSISDRSPAFTSTYLTKDFISFQSEREGKTLQPDEKKLAGLRIHNVTLRIQRWNSRASTDLRSISDKSPASTSTYLPHTGFHQFPAVNEGGKNLQPD